MQYEYHTKNDPSIREFLIGSEIDRIKRPNSMFHSMTHWMTSKILTEEELEHLSKIIGKPCLNPSIVPHLFEIRMTHPDLPYPMEYLTSGSPSEIEELNYFLKNGYVVSSFLAI